MSRPKKLVHRNRLIQFKVTNLELKAIKLDAKELNMTVSDLCRSALFNLKVYKPLTDDEIEAYKGLTQYYVNFTRIANYIKNSDTRLAGEVLSTAREIKEHLQKFKR